MSLLSTALFPFATLYDIITRFRNHLFDIGTKKSVRFDLPVINVGNLAVGGTGKTPHVAYIMQWLLDNHIATASLSRGYGRKTKGFRLASSSDSAETIGDEPMQLYRTFKGKASVAVGEDRVLAIPSILLEKPDTQAIVLDDAYQHRYVSPSLNLLVTDFSRPFYNDFLLPAGRLREARKGANRADAIIVSKCPTQLTTQQQVDIQQEIRKYTSKSTPVFFSSIAYDSPKAIFEQALPYFDKVVLFSGLANATPFLKAAESHYKVLHHFDFPDHHQYSIADIQKIMDKYKSVADAQTILLCTEKDMVKLLQPQLANLLKNSAIAYWPIHTIFLDDAAFQLFLAEKIKI